MDRLIDGWINRQDRKRCMNRYKNTKYKKTFNSGNLETKFFRNL